MDMPYLTFGSLNHSSTASVSVESTHSEGRRFLEGEINDRLLVNY